MRPSEFEAIRPHLEEALDHLDRYLNRQREIEEEAPKLWEAAMAGKLPKAKLRTLTEEEQQEAVRIFRSQPPARIEHAYPWGHSAARAAVDLRDCGWTKEAEAIGEVLSGLPTGPVDGRNPENMARQFDAIQAGAERVKTILTACLAGPKDQDKQAGADQPDAVPPTKSRLSAEARALAVLTEHPDWTNAQIATQVPCHPKSMYRFKKLVAARELLERSRHERAHGSKGRDGAIEAWKE